MKGLNFSLPHNYLDYADYLVNSELFYRNIPNLGILSDEDLNFVKAKLKKAALSSYRNYNNSVLQHLSKEEFLSLQNLHENKILLSKKLIMVIVIVIVIDVVIVDKTDSLDKMNNLLNDTLKAEKN